MYFRSLSVLTTLACAAFSIAAPLGTPVNVNDAKDELTNAVPRDVPPAPAPPAPPSPPAAPADQTAPLEIALNNFVVELKPAVDTLVNCADVSVQVNSNDIKAALINVASVVTFHVGKVQAAATESVDNIRVQVVGGLLATVITTVFTAIAAVAKIRVLAQAEVLSLAGIVATQLAAIVAAVLKAVPAVAEYVVAQVKPIGQMIIDLNGTAVLTTLGVDSPFAS